MSHGYEAIGLNQFLLKSCGKPRELKGLALAWWRCRRRGMFVVATALMFSTISAFAQSGNRAPPILRNNMSQFIFERPVSAAPNTTVQLIDGSSLNLQQFRGKVALVSFWATWCQPCAIELPSLDRLAASADPSRLAIVAVSIDRTGSEAAIPFARSHGLTHLLIAMDPNQRLGTIGDDASPKEAMQISALPITYLIDRENRVIGYIPGITDWTSPAAKRFLDYFINPI